MAREWKEVPDETDEISLEDTQEYRVAERDDEPFEESPPGDEPEEFYEDETREFDDEPEDELDSGSEFEEDEFEEDEFEDGYEDEEADGFYEDDEYFEDVEEEGEPAPADDPVTPAEPEPLPVIGKPYEPVAARVKAIWAGLAARVRRAEMPKLPDRSGVDLKLAAPIAAIVLAALAVGIGAYAIGKGSGDDVDTARIEGEAAGKQAGAIEGASRGYAAGFVKGRDIGFRKTYEEAYRLNFKRAFEQAGLDVPSDKDIDVPEP